LTARETRSMVRKLVGAFGALLLLLSSALAFLVVAMRTKSPGMLGVVRRFNRGFTNKIQMRTAGTSGAWASVIRHRGRRSGTIHETPVVPFESGDGYLIALPYGTNTDWVKNVLSAGSAELVSDGRTIAIDSPQVVSADVITELLPKREQRSQRMFGVDHCLRVRRATETAGA
jgi:deazaflavin-dependent oxidoreductase (nitroreductase family)